MNKNKNNLPLLNKNIVITRSKDKISEVRSLFQNEGAKVFDLPALIIVYPDNLQPLDDALKEINKFNWIIFSSSNGIIFVENRLRKDGLSLKEFSKSLNIAVVGEKTSKTLNDLGIKADYIPPNFIAESLIKNFPISLDGSRILLPRVQSGGRNIIAEEFKSLGAFVLEVAAYESKCPESIPIETKKAFKQKSLDAIIFSSGKTVKNTTFLLKKEFGDEWLSVIKDIKLISIGPQTSSVCEQIYGRVDKEASKYSFEGLLEAAIEYL